MWGLVAWAAWATILMGWAAWRLGAAREERDQWQQHSYTWESRARIQAKTISLLMGKADIECELCGSHSQYGKKMALIIDAATDAQMWICEPCESTFKDGRTVKDYWDSDA